MSRRTAIRNRLLVLLAGMLIGAVAGAALSFPIEDKQPTSTAVITLSPGPHAGDHGDDQGVQAQYTEGQAGNVAALVGSTEVRQRIADSVGIQLRPDDTISGLNPDGTEVVQVTVTSDNASGLRAKATAAAQAMVELLTQQQLARQNGVTLLAKVSTSGQPVDDQRIPAAKQYAVLGAVLGFLLAMLLLDTIAPGPWRRRIEAVQPMSVAGGARQMAAEIEAVIDNWARGCRTLRGAALPIAALFAVFGYALTGSVLPPLIVALIGGYKGLRDPRYAAASLGLCSLTVLPVKLDLVKIGPVTPTVLEVSLVLGLLCTVLRPGGGRMERTAFTPILLAVLGSVVLGAVVGYAGGGDGATIRDDLRALLVVTSFFVMYRAFRHRAAELLAMLLIGGSAACLIELISLPLKLTRLQEAANEVLTGADLADVSRLNSPVLMLCGPLLLLLFSGVVSHRNRWVMVALGAPVLAMEAFSFNRSTWGPLLAAFVMISGVCWGNRGIVRRALGLVLIGGIVLGLASGGALGDTGDALALRVNSLISGEALQEDSLTDRLKEDEAAWKTLRESPVLGTGVGPPYGGVIVSYNNEMGRLQIDPRPYMHLQYLRIWLLFGALGLLCFGAVGVRTISVVFLSWQRRAPGAPTVVAIGFGLALIALQSIFQTTLVTREFIVGSATLLAALLCTAGWQPGRLPVKNTTAERARARGAFAGRWHTTRTVRGDGRIAVPATNRERGSE